MEYLEHLDKIQTIEEKAKYMDLKFRITNFKINGEEAKTTTLNTYAIFYAGVIYGPPPIKMIRTADENKEYKNNMIQYLTIERIFNLFKNGDILPENTETSGAIAQNARAIYMSWVRYAFTLFITTFNKRNNVVYTYAKEFKKLTIDEKKEIIKLYNRNLRPLSNNSKEENEQKIKRFMEIEKKRIEQPETLDFEEQKRTLRGYKCGCGGAYQRPKNDRHFKTERHILYMKRMEKLKTNN